MKYSLFILVCLGLLPISLIAQKTVFPKEGILRATATLSTGNMLKQPVTHIYLNGDLEYYVSEQVSIKGESYYFLGSLMNNHFFEFNHSLFAGISYHLLKEKTIDPYIAFQPGVAYSLAKPGTNGDQESLMLYNASPNPLLSLSIGFNYYASKYFHLFMSTQYINGKYLFDAPQPISLDELRVSFGLGFNLNLKKSKV
ncbi:MAG: hypothetical protein H0V01_07395 [Bacteroidetes bacterium]|nr:hypothetical protein [Bacteroidota bacterium]HET6244183.1 hypothetical protein [Bacteroidia bacterium]